MKFGSVKEPDLVDFTLPEDHHRTSKFLPGKKNLKEVYVGCAKWNKTDLKKFYPKGTKDELAYYSSQFNCIELNATFYSHFSEDQIETWRTKVPDNFKFFPKVHQRISHLKRLNEVDEAVEYYTEGIRAFKEKMGMIFLQLHDNFKPKTMDRLETFCALWPADLPLAIELRNTEWFNDEAIADHVYKLFEQYKITNIITDTAGRRDLLHMRLTTPTAFVRYVGANHPSDWTRMDDWIERIKTWVDGGLENLYFFVHQNLEKESPVLATKFIEMLNVEFGLEIKVPDKFEG